MNIGTDVPSKRANIYKCQAIVSLLKSGLYSTAGEKGRNSFLNIKFQFSVVI